MNKRRVTVTLSLWTDAEIEVLQSPLRWANLLLGHNPSFADVGREPTLRLDQVAAEVGQRTQGHKIAPGSWDEEKKEGKTIHACCLEPRNRPHKAGCPNKKPKQTKKEAKA